MVQNCTGISFVAEKTMGKERTEVRKVHIGERCHSGSLYRQFNTRTSGLLKKKRKKRSRSIDKE